MGTQGQPLIAWLVWQHSGSVLVSSTTRNTRTHHLSSQGSTSVMECLCLRQTVQLWHTPGRKTRRDFWQGRWDSNHPVLKGGDFCSAEENMCVGGSIIRYPPQTLLGVNICGSTHAQQQLTQVAVCVFTCPRHPSSFSLVLSKSPHLIC